jgi:hypothetical protein
LRLGGKPEKTLLKTDFRAGSRGVFLYLSSDGRHLYFREGIMSKKFFVRTVAIMLVIGILAFTVPALKSAERKTTPKANILQLLRQPMLLLSSLFPASTIAQGSVKVPAGSTVPAGRVKPTSDSPVLRPGTGD